MRKISVIEMIDKKPKSYRGVKKLLYYIYNPIKTVPELMDGLFCCPNPKTAYLQFVAAKEEFQKTTGVQAIHFVQSFKSGEITPEIAKEVADKLVQFSQFQNFQIAYAVHTDKEHIHTHFVINSVGLDGRKWHQSNSDLEKLKDYADEICREYNLSVCEREHTGHRASGEFRLGVNSYKYELYLAALNAKKTAISYYDFVNKLNMLGYNVDLRGDKKKYFTFTMPNNRKVRNRNLYPAELFTYDEIMKTLEFNKKNFSFAEVESGNKFFEYAKNLSKKIKLPLSHIIQNQNKFNVYGKKPDDFSKLNREQLIKDERSALLSYYIPRTTTVADSKEKFISLFNSYGFEVEFIDDKILFKSTTTKAEFKNTEFISEDKDIEKFGTNEILQNIDRNALKKEIAHSVIITAKHSLSFEDFVAKMAELNIEVSLEENKDIIYKKADKKIKNTELYLTGKYEMFKNYKTLKDVFDENKQNKQSIVLNSSWRTIVDLAWAADSDNSYPISTNSVLCSDPDIKSYMYRLEESESLFAENLKGYIKNKQSEWKMEV